MLINTSKSKILYMTKNYIVQLTKLSILIKNIKNQIIILRKI